jgi:hypothetical protein
MAALKSEGTSMLAFRLPGVHLSTIPISCNHCFMSAEARALEKAAAEAEELALKAQQEAAEALKK